MNATKKYLLKHGIQAAMRLSGYPRSTLYAWANGSRKPDAARLDEISQRLGIHKEKLRPDIFGK
jgi:transcriptional regulator with XRE-family HTH domain